MNFNKPIYLGTSILDLSKVLMQDFYYNYIKNKYGNRTEMLLKDTDSCLYNHKKIISLNIDNLF